MGILQSLPSEDQLTSILEPVLGNGEQGTGIAGVLRLLEQLDTKNLTGVSDRTVGPDSLSKSHDRFSSITGGTLTQLQQTVGAIPDPTTLLKPLTDTFDKIKSLVDGWLIDAVADECQTDWRTLARWYRLTATIYRRRFRSNSEYQARIYFGRVRPTQGMERQRQETARRDQAAVERRKRHA